MVCGQWLVVSAVRQTHHKKYCPQISDSFLRDLRVLRGFLCNVIFKTVLLVWQQKLSGHDLQDSQDIL